MSSAALNAIASPTRREILRALADQPQSVGDLARQLPVSRPAVSQHLRVLEDARLVAHTARGTRRIYRLDPTGFVAARA